jgi:predicted nucleic acid-binding protein
LSIYADSSFFMSVYLRDGHTPEALRRLRSRQQIWLTPLNKVEIAHGIAQKVFRRELSTGVADQMHKQLAGDCDAGLWLLTDFPALAFETAAELARKHIATLGTRTLDTLHIASALELKATQFWTFDGRQAKLAKTVGLKVS